MTKNLNFCENQCGECQRGENAPLPDNGTDTDTEAAEPKKATVETDPVFDWSAINVMAVQHRSKAAADIMRAHFPEISLDLCELRVGKGPFYRIVRPGAMYDGNRETAVSLQMGMMYLLGAYPLGFLEGLGRIDRPVKPVAGHENRQSTTGTRKFGPHIDHGAGRFPWEGDDGRMVQPDWLSLATIDNPHAIGTMFADPKQVYIKLLLMDEEAARDLMRPEASLPSPPSVQPAKISVNVPIIVQDPNGFPGIRIYPRTIAETERMERALNVLDKVLEDPDLWAEIALVPGEMIIARGTAIHKRGAVTGPRELTAMYGRDLLTKGTPICEAYPYLERV